MFYYDGVALEFTKQLKYLGVVFTTGGSFAEAQNTLAGQAQKAIFNLNTYLKKFTFISPKHKLDLFDKLISPIFNCAYEMWGYIQANSIERVHLQFCKNLLGVKKTNQNDFIYGERGRTSYQVRRYLFIVKYWLKLLSSQVISILNVYIILCCEILSFCLNWASLVRHLFGLLGFYEVWVQQGVGDYSKFISVLKQT